MFKSLFCNHDDEIIDKTILKYDDDGPFEVRGMHSTIELINAKRKKTLITVLKCEKYKRVKQLVVRHR